MGRRLALVGALVWALALGCRLTVSRVAQPAPVELTASAAAQAFEQGVEAARLGLQLEACPFSSPAARRAWRAGWRWAHGRG